MNGSYDDYQGNESDNNGSRRVRNNKRARTVSDEPKPRYACPYYKYDPARFRQRRACCGPGWADIHQVKENFYRAHHLRSWCKRCYEPFDESGLEKHMRAAQSCTMKEPKTTPQDLVDGFTEVQLKKLRKRTRKPEQDKWVELYCILLEIEPGSADIPSPYHNSSDWRESHANRQYYQPYVEYLRREIFRRIQIELDEALESSIESNALDEIPNVGVNLLRDFQNIPPPPNPLTENNEG